METPGNSLRFTPSKVDGIPAVTEVEVFSNRIELLSDNAHATIRFANIARWGRRAWLYRPLSWAGWVCDRPAVADRDWFHPPTGRFFRFYSTPSVTIYLPDESGDVPYEHTLFRRIQNVIASGGFSTNDLG